MLNVLSVADASGHRTPNNKVEKYALARIVLIFGYFGVYGVGAGPLDRAIEGIYVRLRGK